MTEPLQITILGDTEPVREAKANPGAVEVLNLFEAPQTIRGQLAMPEPEPAKHVYIGACKTRGCRAALRVADHADSVRQPQSAFTYVQWASEAADPRAGYCVGNHGPMARCLDHGLYPLRELAARTVATVPCDRRCTSARGPKCDCSCGGHNHGADHG